MITCEDNINTAGTELMKDVEDKNIFFLLTQNIIRVRIFLGKTFELVASLYDILRNM
jgi:hypothetical protein